MSRTLHIPAVPLHGLQMIEASAGTGKTWTIAALYLRLLLERALPVEKILVVTYTNAATAELRARIRQRLLEAQQACAAGGELVDPVLSDILTRVPQAHAQVLLTLALESFDLAAIHTIHGFCQRALAERAFESGLPFESELASDDRRVLHEAVEDFWRREINSDSDPLWLGWLLCQLPGPGSLLSQLLPHFGKPYLQHVLPPLPDAGAAQRYAQTFSRVQMLWQREGEAALAELMAHPGLNQTSHKPAQINAAAAAIGRWLSGEPNLAVPKTAENLGARRLEDKTKKGHTAPVHLMFAALDELIDAAIALEAVFTARLGHLWQRALQACEANVRAARQRLATRSFDDLLLDLHAALHAEGGATLAAALRQRYAAALIDEFQDTDPLQYGIFAAVFVEPPAVAEAASVSGMSTLCAFVGDPKQAIYSFRGADLQAYLDARQQAGEPLLLDTNRRSSAALIGAVNALFAAHERPFLDAELRFDPVRAPDNAPGPLMLDDAPLPALDVWFVPRTEAEAAPRAGGKYKGRFGSIPKNRATRAIADAVAGSIAALLTASAAGRVSLDDKGVRRQLAGQDIAVLVKSHHQGEQVHMALQALGVASVRYGQDSIFETQDALDVERILLAIAHPAREGLVRAALATRLMGMRGDRLATLDGAAWLECLEDFHRWHVLAREQGFIRMWRSWQLEADVAPRLLALPDGERLMTNLLHLSDLLATLAHDDQLGIEALAKHLADARNDERSENNSGEGRLLRLESDENLVRIVTIHTSKGLEYPVTYCPFLWDGKLRENAGPLRYHDPEQAHAAALDFGSPALDAHKAQAEHESRAEALRLAYVALTRARQHCVLVWGAMADAETSPLAWLLHGGEAVDPGSMDDAAMRAHLQTWRQRCADIGVQDLPTPARIAASGTSVELPALQARSWPQRGLAPWRMHSFSGWLQSPGVSVAASDELPDHDETAALPPAAEVVELMKPALPSGPSFPAGADAGTCLHAMFEVVDFAAPEPALIAASLEEYGFAPELQPLAIAMLDAALNTPMSETLPPLCQIPRGHQIREMEFMLPVQAPDMAALATAIGPDAGADGQLATRVRSLQPAHLGGFLKGFIDLVFMHEERYYVLDYKSNRLGLQPEDYAPAALAVAMADALYDLQALLYSVALHLALEQRLPNYDYERHCGGSLYLFLRGMQAQQPGSGVFAWRPSQAMVERVAACLQTKARVLLC